MIFARTQVAAVATLTVAALPSSFAAIASPSPTAWTKIAQSGHVHHHGRCCGTPPAAEQLALYGSATNFVPSDCSFVLTNPDPMYDPANLPIVEIDVVFHLFQDHLEPDPALNGFVPYERIIEQVEVLNEDFSGQNQSSGIAVDTRIRFKLAEMNEFGAPSTGIRRREVSALFNDTTSYWAQEPFDPDRFLNVYSVGTPDGDPNLTGYVPYFPQSGLAGNPDDRIVVRWDTIGRNAPNPTFGKGHILTHEVGHYLGLFHTFATSTGNCIPLTANQYTTGDLIEDTRPHLDTYLASCPPLNLAGCNLTGGAAPTRNFMGYMSDACKDNFSFEQAMRMRCTLDSYRPLLAHAPAAPLGTTFCNGVPNITGFRSIMSGIGSSNPAANDVQLVVSGMLPSSFGNAPGYPVASKNVSTGITPGSGVGNLCVGPSSLVRINQPVLWPNNRGEVFSTLNTMDLRNNPNNLVVIQPGETWYFQLWHRDFLPNGMSTSNFSNGYAIQF